MSAIGRCSTGAPDRVANACLVVLAGVLSLFGLVVRIWMVDHLPITSDQAVNGLMSLDILHGHFGAITWGQTYGGVEPYVTSVLFALFGHSDTTLDITPVVLSFTASVQVYLIGRQFLARRLAGLGALAVWVWPAIVVSNGTQELGYRFACLNLGLLAIICAIRLRRRGPSSRRYAVLGVTLGLCLWADPECIYFLVPCAVLVAPVVVRAWSSDRNATASGLLWGVTGVLVGGLPFWWSTLSSHAVPIAPYPGTLGTRATALVTHALPLALGLQVPGTGAWTGGPVLGITAYVVVLVSLIAGVVWALVRHRPRTVVCLVAFVVAYPVIYSLLPGTWYWQDGRYIVYLPYLLVVVALYPVGLLPWHRLVTGAVALFVSGAALLTVAELTTAVPGLSWGALPHAFVVKRVSLASLVAVLENHRIRLGYAGYWVAYNLDFESGGRLTFTPTDSDVVRNAAYLRQVDDAATPAWIVCQSARSVRCVKAAGNAAVDPPGVTATSFTAWLHRRGIASTTLRADGFAVVLPATKVTPAQLRSPDHRPGAATIRPARTASTSSR